MKKIYINLTILGILLICLGIVSNNLSEILLTNDNVYNNNETNLKSPSQPIKTQGVASIVDSFPSPHHPTELAWDGQYLWIAENDLDKIHKVNPSTGAVIYSFDAPGNEPSGLTWDGLYLWVADWNNDRIYKINPSTGAVIYSFDSPGSQPTGLAWDGQYLWNADNDAQGTIFKINPSSGAVVDSFDSPSIDPKGLAWDGQYLWVSITLEAKIYKIDSSNGVVVDLFHDLGNYAAGLAWDGQYLWESDHYAHNVNKLNVKSAEDVIPPTIGIFAPEPNDLLGITAPSFNVKIYDASLDTMWYTLDNGLTNTTFTTNGTISQTLWDTVSNGTVIWTFYANDSAGNIGFAEVTIRKNAYTPIIIDSDTDRDSMSFIIIIIIIILAVTGLTTIIIIYPRIKVKRKGIEGKKLEVERREIKAKKRKERKPKGRAEREKQEIERREKQIKLEQRFPMIERLIQDKKFSGAIKELNNIIDIAEPNNFTSVLSWAEIKLNLCNTFYKLYKLFKISESVNINDVASILDMDRQDLLKKLIDWSEVFKFTIDGEYLKIKSHDLESFMELLDESYDKWESPMKRKQKKE